MMGKNDITTVNGIEFTSKMFDKLNEWYADVLDGDSMPDWFIEDLVSIQGYFIKHLADADEEKRDEICRHLTKTNWIIENLKPFSKKNRPSSM